MRPSLVLLVPVICGCVPAAMSVYGLTIGGRSSNHHGLGLVPVAEMAFVDSGQRFGPGDARAVAADDVDEDGDIDLLFAFEDGGVRVFANDGLGAFTDTGQALQPSFSEPNHYVGDIAVEDVDLDGDVDLALSGWDGTTIWVNDGGGTFTNSGQLLIGPGDEASRMVDFGDFDRDGAVDLLAAESNHLVLYLNDGLGVFSRHQSIFGQFTGTRAVGDLDDDGDLDIVMQGDGAAGSAPEQPLVLLNDGSGTLVHAGVVPVTRTQPVFILSLNDMDADGDLDVVGGSNPGVWIALNPGDGDFSDAAIIDYQAVIPERIYDMALGDLDGDGNVDIVAQRFRDTVAVFLNVGQPALGLSTTLTGTDLEGSERTLLADLDQDGDLDIAFAFARPAESRVYFNQGLAGP